LGWLPTANSISLCGLGFVSPHNVRVVQGHTILSNLRVLPNGRP
jgi:hypothetical protein